MNPSFFILYFSYFFMGFFRSLDKKRKNQYNITSYYQLIGKEEILKSAKKENSLAFVKRKKSKKIGFEKRNHEVWGKFMEGTETVNKSRGYFIYGKNS